MIIEHKFDLHTYLFDTSTIQFADFAIRPMQPQVYIMCSRADANDDHQFPCASSTRLFQSCKPLLKFIRKHHPELLL